VLLALLYAVSAALGLLNMWSLEYAAAAGIVLAISVVLFLIFKLGSAAIRKTRSTRHFPADGREFREKTGFMSLKTAFLVAFFLLAKFGLNMMAKKTSLVAVVISLHVILLVLIGFISFRLINSDEYVPILASITIVALDSLLEAGQFLANPSARFRYGPEIVFFAANRFSMRMALLPMFTVMTWGSWKILDTMRTSELSRPDVTPRS